MPSVGAVVHAGPHPSLDVVRHWKGIVEIVLRAVVAVSERDKWPVVLARKPSTFHFYSLSLPLQLLVLVGIIACAAAQDDVSSDDIDEKLLERSNAASGWGIFLCFVALLTEGIIILMRFLNFGFIQQHLTLALIVVRMIHPYEWWVTPFVMHLWVHEIPYIPHLHAVVSLM